MPARVTLKAVSGALAGSEFTFEERTACIVGRDTDCTIRLPENDPTVSRHHCLLDINPPAIAVRDFGSMNGTYLNGVRIGQRAQDVSAEETMEVKFPEHELKEGDTLGLGQTSFGISVSAPLYCGNCRQEILEAERKIAEASPGNFRCSSCMETCAGAPGPDQRTSKLPTCGKCGKCIDGGAPEEEHGVVLCESCHTDPFAVLDVLLELAKSGKREGLLAIQGYVVEKELGRGGMGSVYLARHEQTGERVALKVMLPKVALRPRAKDMFLREIENTKALRHRNIVEMKDHGCSHGTFFMTLEFCDGGNVDELVARRGGKLPFEEAMRIVFEVIDGLEYAHNALVPNVRRPDGSVGRGQGLVHRDIKPLNIFLAGSGPEAVAKVADYGLSKAFDNAGLSGQTCTGASAGSPCFLPRQQVINFKYAKPEVDVWATAAMLYYMLSGTHPRDYPSNRDPWQITLQTDPVPIRQRAVSVPAALAEVLDAALKDRPALRFKTADELRQALRSAL